MLDFLRQKGISDTIINEIIHVNVESNIYNLSCNQDEVLKIIDYLNSLGVKCVDKLLIYRIDKFFLSFDIFKNKFMNADKGNLVNLLNDDYTIIDEL